jgi:FAD/FMN-containing dehydrogenase
MQAAQLWALRDDVEQILRIGPVFMFDVGLPIPEMENYVTQVRSEIARQREDSQCVVWGHMGDSNLHLWITVHDESAAARARVERIVYAPLAAIGGTVSAEHGIGAEKLRYLGLSRSAAEVSLMRHLKRNLDPKGILNPGKVIS